MKKNILSFWLFVLLNSLLTSFASAQNNSEWIDAWNTKTVTIGTTLGTFSPNTWYFFFQGRPAMGSYELPSLGEVPSNKGGVLADNGVGNPVVKKHIIGLNGCRASNVTTFLVRFLPVPDKEGVYYIQFGTGNYMGAPSGSGNNSSFICESDVNSACEFNVYNIDDTKPGYFACNVYDMGMRVDNQGTGNRVVTWNSGRRDMTTGDNGVWNIVEVIWDDLTEPVKPYNPDHPVTEYPSLFRHDLAYFDYDGDGKMEMYGFYNNENGDFGLMDEDKIIKTLSIPYVYNSYDVLEMMINERHAPIIANGKGDINIGNFILRQDDSVEDISDKIEPVSITSYGKMLFADFDNDGCLDGAKKTSILLQQQDGTYLLTTPNLVQDSAYLAYLKTISNSGTNPLSFDGMVISGLRTGEIRSSGISRAIDLNGDGRLDLLKENDWTAYISCGDNSYIHLGFNGEIYPYDLNGDGILDYLLYDNENVYIVLCDSRGQTTQKQIFSNSKVKDFVCRDFDHDGDVDVLAYIVDSSNTYFVFMRNDGNGTFKKKEAYLSGLYTLHECKDYDADGLYEVLLCRVIQSTSTYDMDNRIIKICGDFTLSDVSLPIPYNLGTTKWEMGDFDNDGYTDFHLVNGVVNTYTNYNNYVSKYKINKDMPYMVGHFYPYQEKRNTAPQKMSKPSVTLDENTGFLRIVWERGEDAETSACDLTYEVRIGTAPGLSDILCAPSIADGRRRVPVDGAMGTQTQTLFNIAKHSAGSYYIAVQAVDAGGLGGAWSDEAVYENTYTAPTLIADKTYTSTPDAVTIIANEFQDDVSYEWSATNGEVISQEGNRAKVKFHAAGAQYVKLTSIYRGARYQSEPLKIEVQAFKAKEDGDYYTIDESLDLNQDGYPDGFSHGVLVVNNGKGAFSKYPKSFNSDLTIYYSRIIDLNRDGFPDILGFNESSQEGNILINDQEGDFEISLHDVNFKGWVPQYYSPEDISVYILGGKWVDFSNTNEFNILTNDNNWADGGWLKTKDFCTYSFMGTHEQITGRIDLEDYIVDICDINRDGFWDVVYDGIHQNDGNTTLFAMMNNGDGTFRRMNLLERNEYEMWDDYGYSMQARFMRDINNDGVLDFIESREKYINKESIYKILIYCGSVSNGQYSLQLQKVIADAGKISSIQDYDNNGYLDLDISSGKDSGKRCSMLLFDYDLNYQRIITEGSVYSTFFVRDGTGYPLCNTISNIKNEVPKAPTAVSVRQTEAGMVINWSDAEDDHTSAAQMRYNVSVKRKGMNGEDSYIISPMNGGNGKAALVFPWYYKQSTTMTIPKSALTAGETYEVQVQAIDLWNQWSPMTNPVEITISAEEGVIVVPDVACVNRETEVTYTGVLNAEASFSFGEDSQYKRNGTTFNVTWSRGGVKDITIGNHHSQIFVREPIDVSFSLPDDIFVGGDLPIDVNHEMATQGSKGNFRFVASPKGARVSVDYTPGEEKAWLRFNKSGHYEIEAYCEDEVLGNTSVYSFEAKDAPLVALDRVTADDGYYTLKWNTSEIHSAISKVIIYKETNSLNQFVVLDTVDIATGQYTDLTSAPHVVSARYKIALLSDGNQTFESKVHKPLHVMIASAAGGGYNLMWNPYEGLKVDNYRIWRGTSKDDMELLTQIAGSLQSFTDTEVLDGEVFYAVSFTPVSTAASVKGLLRAPNDEGDIFSNIISTRSAANLIPATSLFIVAPSEECVLTEENNTLQLNYQLLPVSCTCSQLSWSIVEGESLATISQDGLLTAIEGIGNVRVRVSTIDGSNLSDEITVLVNKQVLAESIVINETQLSFTSKDETAQLSVSIMPENAADKSVIWKSSNNRVASVTEKGLVTAVSSGTATITVTTNDGSNLSAECFVSVDIPDDRLLVETFMLYCKRGYVGFDGTHLCGTTDENASQFAIIDYGGTNYLYDVTNSAFVVHTANMKAATTGNPLLESTTNISKAVTGLNWGTTGYNAYPWYLEDSFGNWLNMDKKPLVYMNTWRDFEGANGGNTYQKVIVESSYDATEALQILENYFNPKSTVTFVFKEPNTTSQSQPIPVLTGTVIDEVPAELRKGYCSYEMSPTIVHTGNNIVNVTVSYDLPFTISTDFESATWYYAKIRNYYYLNMGASEPYYPTSDNEENDNFKWAFMGTPHTGFVILNKAAGEDMCLTKDGEYVVMREDGKRDRWDLIENGAGFNVLRQGSIADFITQMNNSSGPLGIWTDQRGMDQIGSQWLLEFAESGGNSYMLTYMVDGEVYKTSRVTYGTVLTPETAPSKEGYTFSGWSVIPTTMPSHDVIVVGSFTANKYKVRYYVGEQLWAEDEVVYGSKLTLRDYTPADANRYSFAGWDGVKFETMPAKDIEYRAMIVDGIGGLNADTNVIEAIYDGTGRKLSKMQRGVNVLRMKDGTMRKVFR